MSLRLLRLLRLSIKQTNKTQFQLYQQQQPSLEELISSIQHILGGQRSDTTLDFNALSVEPFNDKQLSYDNAHTLVGYLSKQIMFLQSHHHMTFIGLDTSDILVINKNIFVIANASNLLPFDPQTNITELEQPFIKPQFISPVIRRIDTIPALINTKNMSQYCLALLTSSLLNMDSIKYTKLYWCLSRVIKTESEDIMILI